MVKRCVILGVFLFLFAGFPAWAQDLDAEAFHQARLDKLLASLGGDNDHTRALATDQIVAMGNAAVPRLIKELDRKDDFVRVQVILILNTMGVKKVVPRYVEILPEAVRRQAVAKRQNEEYNDKKQKLDEAERNKKTPVTAADRAVVDKLKNNLPRLFPVEGIPQATDVEVASLSKGIADMGDESNIPGLTAVILESRKDSTIQANHWKSAWRPVWEALEKLFGQTVDPETLRKCVGMLRLEVDAIQKKATRSTAEAHFVSSFEELDLLVDARLDILLYH